MCVLCFNSQWRSVLIGSVAASFSLLLLLLTAAYKDSILGHFEDRLRAEGCITDDNDDDSRGTAVSSSNSNESTSMGWTKAATEDNDCIFLVFSALFPWPLWSVFSAYFVLNAVLVVSAVYG